MANQVTVTNFFNIPVHELYSYFTDARLIERWSAPDGMTLKVPVFEYRVGGRYRYEHQSEHGRYVCEGHFRSIQENSLLRLVDDEITDPQGKVFSQKLNCDITFKPLGHGTEVTIVQSGFKDKGFASECEQSWQQCFNKLHDLVKDSSVRQMNSGAAEVRQGL